MVNPLGGQAQTVLIACSILPLMILTTAVLTSGLLECARHLIYHLEDLRLEN